MLFHKTVEGIVEHCFSLLTMLLSLKTTGLGKGEYENIALHIESKAHCFVNNSKDLGYLLIIFYCRENK